ncbi:hypothetical protein [Actinoplanes sp. NPDC049265]|uniref:hypothetical protein n=1 Tax=Actinoplanes sp. NPDC049265 TaxID=3363902 RepID=UPI00371E2339
MATAVQIVQVAKDATTALAVIVGGGWAYLKFARGRLFAPRAELSVAAAMYESVDGLMVVATVTLVNRGVRRFRLKDDGKVLYVYELRSDAGAGPALLSEEKVALVPILTSHDWLETAEQVQEETTVQLGRGAGHDRAGFRLEAQVWSPPGLGRRSGFRWISSVTAPGPGWTKVKDSP